MSVISVRKGKVGLLAIMLGAAISSTVLDIPTFVSAEVTKQVLNWINRFGVR
jgi:hypothetical protein